ncbi:MFS transporter [Lentilactobacillus otakiensis]|uniref:MFS transporter n=1 Tax=Lentilactobacillus otakiensis TaxID=481720 RepID=UPI003D1738B0
MKNTQTHEWLALTAIGLFTVMANLDSSIVNIALPTLSRDFKIPTSMAAYTVIIYMVVMSGLLVLGGRLGDIISKSRIFKYGMYVFTLGSLLASISPSFGLLQIARIVQAIGASATLANSYGLISQIFPPATRGKAMGFNTLFISGGFIIGPALGGLLLQHFIWQSIFMINLPIGVIAIIMGTLFLPHEQSGKMPKKFDWLGAVLLFFAISAFILFLEIGQTIGFSNLIVIGMVVIFAIVGIWLVIREQRHSSSLLDMSIFKIREFTLTLFALVFVMMTNSFFDIVFPFYLQSILKWSVGAAGLMMIVFPAVMAIVAPLGGGLGDRERKISCVNA